MYDWERVSQILQVPNREHSIPIIYEIPYLISLAPNVIVIVELAPTAKSISSNPLRTLGGSPASVGYPRYNCGISVPADDPVLVNLKDTTFEDPESVIARSEYSKVVYDRPNPNSKRGVMSCASI